MRLKIKTNINTITISLQKRHHSNTLITARERIPPGHHRLEQAHCSKYRQGNDILCKIKDHTRKLTLTSLTFRAPLYAPWASPWWGARWSRGSRVRWRGGCWRTAGWCPPPPPSRPSTWRGWTSTPGIPPVPTLMMSPSQTWSEAQYTDGTWQDTYLYSLYYKYTEVVLCYKEGLNKENEFYGDILSNFI